MLRTFGQDLFLVRKPAKEAKKKCDEWMDDIPTNSVVLLAGYIRFPFLLKWIDISEALCNSANPLISCPGNSIEGEKLN